MIENFNHIVGNLLVKKGVITQEVLDKALEIQQKGGGYPTIGIILNKKFKIPMPNIDKAVCEFIEKIANTIVKKKLLESITQDKLIKSRVDFKIFLGLMDKIKSDIKTVEIVEKRTLVKRDGDFVPLIDNCAVENMTGRMHIEISFKSIPETVQFTTTFTYAPGKGDLQIPIAGDVPSIRVDLIDMYRQYLQKQAKTTQDPTPL